MDIFTLSAPGWYLREDESAELLYQFFVIREGFGDYEPISELTKDTEV